MSENENDEDVNKLNDKYFFIDEEFRTMNESQDDEQTKISNECKNDLFLQRINKNILENTSGIKTIQQFRLIKIVYMKLFLFFNNF